MLQSMSTMIRFMTRNWVCSYTIIILHVAGYCKRSKTRSFISSHRKMHFFIDMINDSIDVLRRHIQNGEISIVKTKVDAFTSL
jgi:hypothetical protein